MVRYINSLQQVSQSTLTHRLEKHICTSFQAPSSEAKPRPAQGQLEMCPPYRPFPVKQTNKYGK